MRNSCAIRFDKDPYLVKKIGLLETLETDLLHIQIIVLALIGFQGGGQMRARKLDGRYNDIIMALHFDS